MNMLGIETSCDETAVAVVSDGGVVRANHVYSQIERHRPHGGVVPEIAARAHVEALPGLLTGALAEAGLAWADVDALAVTCGPGLASSLIVGVTAAQALALRLHRPLWSVNHLEGHLHSIVLGAGEPAPLPALVLLVSGGHTCLVRVAAPGRYEVLGQTLDDAAGEALDKGAKLLGLGYPGGPAIERAAAGGNPRAIAFPRGAGGAAAAARQAGGDLWFSFSGLKTALLYHVRAHPEAAAGEALRDTAASYQEAVVDALIARVERALDGTEAVTLGAAGGVACNRRLREKLGALAAVRGLRLAVAEPRYCTDNAAMIAAAALAGFARRADPPGDLDAHPVLPLGERG